MLQALSTRQNRILTIVLLALCGACALAAVIVGIDDNLPGILLAFGAAVAFILAFAHPWRTAKQFRRLFLGALLGFVVFAVLHNLFEGLAAKFLNTGVLQVILQAAGVVAFFIAVLVCPAALVVGVIGSLGIFIRNRRRTTTRF